MTNETKAAIEEAANNSVNQAGLTDTADRANFFEGFDAGSKEVINNPGRYGLIRRYDYTALADREKRLTAILRDVDDLMMSLEDYIHGKDGHKITELRHKIEVEIP